MKKTVPAPDPEAYVAALDGWRRRCVEQLRDGVRGAATFEEVIRWGHLVYVRRGPVLLIRAEEQRVLFGFWRGQLLRGVEPRLMPGGKYEMATLELREGDEIGSDTIAELARRAAGLNDERGDPTRVPPPGGG
jgi:hypothetical protein